MAVSFSQWASFHRLYRPRQCNKHHFYKAHCCFRKQLDISLRDGELRSQVWVDIIAYSLDMDNSAIEIKIQYAT
jgi:transcriptional antiterminator Rof (Rho-off)